MQNGQNTPYGVLLYSKRCVLPVDVWFYAMRWSALKATVPFFLCFGRIVAAEKHRYAPYSRKTDNRINYPRKNCHLTAEYRTDEIVTEKADKQPVDCAYNNQTK